MDGTVTGGAESRDFCYYCGKEHDEETITGWISSFVHDLCFLGSFLFGFKKSDKK